MKKDEILSIIEDKKKKISNSAINKDSGNCSLSNSSSNSIGLCSLELVLLLVELEDIFQIEFNEKIDNISDLVDYIQHNMRVSL